MGSCVGCKFLFGDGRGYSDWTWLDTDVRCALDRNPSLPDAEPFDWNMNDDNWGPTKDGRCTAFSPGPYIVVSPDGEPRTDPIDAEQARAIMEARYIPDDTWTEFREDQ